MILASYARMRARFQAQFHEIRLDLQSRQLHRRERLTLRRLGAEVASTRAADSEALTPLLAEIAEGERRAADLLAEGQASLETDRADLREVAAWMKPVVVVRGVCTRMVLRHRRSIERRALRPRLEALGELVSGSPASEVVALRERRALIASERKRWGAPYGGSALPRWAPRAARETVGFGRAVLMQLRSQVLPKAPALVGLAVGWWVANTYTDSHLRSALRSIGIGSGGTRVVSSSTYETMSFWLPLLGAALCAYLGERIGAFYGFGRQQSESATCQPETIDRSP
jgi:hypothetical protein